MDATEIETSKPGRTLVRGHVPHVLDLALALGRRHLRDTGAGEIHHQEVSVTATHTEEEEEVMDAEEDHLDAILTAPDALAPGPALLFEELGIGSLHLGEGRPAIPEEVTVAVVDRGAILFGRVALVPDHCRDLGLVLVLTQVIRDIAAAAQGHLLQLEGVGAEMI